MSDQLPAPSVDDVDDGRLQIKDPPHEATVRITPYAGMSTGDTVTMWWNGASDDQSLVHFAAIGESDVGREVVFTVAASCTSTPGSASVHYQLQRASGDTEHSATLAFTTIQ